MGCSHWEPQYADWAPDVSCGACGLPWQVQQATLFRDKVAMKEAALSGGMPCPPFKRVSCKPLCRRDGPYCQPCSWTGIPSRRSEVHTGLQHLDAESCLV